LLESLNFMQLLLFKTSHTAELSADLCCHRLC
jgi:hypothetical protein